MVRSGALLAGLALAPLGAFAGDATEGAAIWSSACARCHGDPAALVPRPEPGEEAKAAAALDAFLARHRMPDPARRATLVAWLLSLGAD